MLHIKKNNRTLKQILIVCVLFIITPTIALAVPSSTTLISPSGDITINTPSYSWEAVSNATHYYLWVNDSTGNKIKKWYKADIVGCSSGVGLCTVTPAETLANGTGIWWVQTWNPSGYGAWSTSMNFHLTADLPPDATILNSPNGNITNNTPSYFWEAVSNSTHYYLWVNDSTGNIIKKWYSAESTGCPSGTGTCFVTPTIAHADGSVIWWVQTWNPSGYGPWSTSMNYNLDTSSIVPGSIIWHKSLTSSPSYYLDRVDSVATDNAGNVYISGRTRGDLFGEVNQHHYDVIFLVKYDSNGNKLWHKWLDFGTGLSGFYDSISTDNVGNIYLALQTNGSLFGETNQGGTDAYIVKYDNNGNKLWHKPLASDSSDGINKISTDSANNVYLTGSTMGSLFNETESVGGNDFLVKYNSGGTKLWHKWHENIETSIKDISIDNADNAYLAVRSTENIQMIKYNSNGTELWRQPTDGGVASNISTNGVGDIYLTIVTSHLLFGETTPSSAFGEDLYIVKYDGSGNKLWHYRFYTPYPDHIYENYSSSALTTDALGNIYLSFSNYDYAGLGGSSDGLIYKFNSNGSQIWGQSVGSGFVESTDLAIDNFNDVYLTGNQGNDGFITKYHH